MGQEFLRLAEPPTLPQLQKQSKWWSSTVEHDEVKQDGPPGTCTASPSGRALPALPLDARAWRPATLGECHTLTVPTRVFEGGRFVGFTFSTFTPS